MIVSKEAIVMIFFGLLLFAFALLSVATFGFDRGQYSVVENETFVAVTIRQISGSTLNRNVLITLVTGDGTAVCESLRHDCASDVL